MMNRMAENWMLKLISLVFALVLWFFVMGEQKLEVGYTVPLELKNVPKGMLVANEVPSLVDVRLSGPRTMLINLSPSDISISVDLTGLQPGLTSFKRLEERLNIPTGIKVTRLSPSFVDVKLERIRTKEVPVRALVNGAPAEGYRLGTIEIRPERVEVEGAEGELKDLNELSTDTIEVEGLTSSFTVNVPIDYRGKYTQLVEQHTVEVRVVIEPVPPRTTKKKKNRST